MKGRFIVGAVIAAAFGIIVLVNFLRPSDAFFSGDGGLKLTQIQQLRAGRSGILIDRTVPPWVRDAWDAGFFPFHAPFVREKDGRVYSVFPVYYPALNVPLYSLLGFRGLLILPMLALLILWIRFAALLRERIESIFARLTALVFVSAAAPLLIYGMIFWEHAPAVLLSYFGLEFFIRSLDENTPASGTRGALVFGFIAGCASWLRPETIAFNAGLTAILLLSAPGARRKAVLFFAGAMALSTGGFFLANTLIYGTPLGLHSSELAGQMRGARGLGDSLGILAHMSRELIAYYAIVLPLIAFLPAMFRRRGESPYFALGLVMLLFMASASLVLPNAGARQWGPRYLMPLVPLIAYMTALLIMDQKQRGGKLRRFAFVFVLGLVLLHGLVLNGIAGPVNILKDYRTRVSPLLEETRKASEQYIIVDHQWTALELGVFFQDRIFLRADNEKQMAELMGRMRANNAGGFLYLSRKCESGQAAGVKLIDVKRAGTYGFCRGVAVK